MGKKIKKDEKGPPEDVFDSLLVESRQAKTVVLMLSSPEDEVLSKACEAIYKFVDKCDENKKALLDLNAHEALLKLVTHEERMVRRNAVMALGVMASHAETRKALRKCEETIPSMVALMGPEEDTVSHEFAALCLSSMAQDYSSKVAIFEQDGLEALIRCLSSSDPDVQKNSIETISLMLQDYQTKAALRDQNGLMPLLDLLRSEYPVIQHLALVSLQRATEDPDNRAALRELEGVNKLIEFIGRPDWQDLHVFAVMVLSNCLEDTETMEQIKENSGLQKLVAYITDTTPPEEEDTKSKGKKGADKGASRAGKKGKGDDASSARSPTPKGPRGTSLSRTHTSQGGMKSSLGGGGKKSSLAKAGRASGLGGGGGGGGLKLPGSRLSIIAGSVDGSEAMEEDRDANSRAMMASRVEIIMPEKGGVLADGKTAADPVIPTMPEVKEHAAKAIARAAKNPENRKILHEQEAEKMLIQLLSHDNQGVQVACAQALGVMSENLVSRESVGQWDGIEPLVKMSKNDNADVREAASMALANLTTANMNNSHEVNRYHGIDPLISLLSDQRELAVANAAICLTNMAPDEQLRRLCHNAGVVNALIDPLSSTNSLVQSKVAVAIGAFVCDQDARNAFRENHGVEPLIRLLRSNNDDVRRSVSWALTVCAVDEQTAVEVTKAGGLDILQEIQLSSTRKNAFTDVAIQKLLNSNLSAKYALTGHLAPTDVIGDGFFDLGSLRPGTSLLTIEEYCKQDVNQKRAILLVNAKPEKPQTPAPQPSEQEITEKSSKSSVGGRSSRTGRDKAAAAASNRQSPGKRKEREREKAQAQQEQEDSTTQEEGPFVIPGDYTLMKYVDETVDKVKPLPSTRDQAMALAVFVAEKMGGPIDKGQLANFSWELQLSQLKFDQKSNVVPIGMIKFGIHYHRALLFKALSDRIALGSSLVRGEYNRAWNVVMVADDDDSAPGGPKFPPKAYLVDLIHHPGKLLPLDSAEAVNYQKL